MRFCFLLCGGVGVDSDTVWNENHTSTAARMVSVQCDCTESSRNCFVPFWLMGGCTLTK